MALTRNLGLVLGGGGARGAFHVGALRRLLPNDVDDAGKKYPRLDFRRIGLVTGTSTGALCASMTAQFLARNAAKKPGDPLDLRDLDVLLALYTTSNVDDIMTPKLKPGTANLINDVAAFLGAAFPADKVVALLVENSIWDQAPLRALIKKHVDLNLQAQAHALGITLVINAFNMTTQRGEQFTNAPGEVAQLHDALIASSAIPAVMTPHPITRNGIKGLYVDGALWASVPYEPAIRVGISRVLGISLNFVGARVGKASYEFGLEVLKDSAYALDQEGADNDERFAFYAEAIGRIRENCAISNIDVQKVLSGVSAKVLTQCPSGTMRRHFTMHFPPGTPVIEDIDFEPAKMQPLYAKGKDTAIGQWQNIRTALVLPAHATP